MLRILTLLSLFIHMASLAATQTAYGNAFLMLRWISLFALAGFGGLNWIVGRQGSLLNSVNTRVLIYLALWGLTVLNAEYILFSSYRWIAHAMIVVSALVFLPRALRMTDLSKLLWALKLIVAVILVVSYFRPAPLTNLDVANMYRGILGNANVLGHMSAVGCLLFLHGFVTQKGRLLGQLQGAMAGLAGILLIQSGARSSLVAIVGGFLVFYVLYKSKLSRYFMLGILGAMAGATAVLVVIPNPSESISEFVLKHKNEIQYSRIAGNSATERMVFTRLPLWERHWEGFKERPLLGWGFGLDSDTDLSGWSGEWAAVGRAGRDPTNDVMYSLESGGIVGLFAYLFMLGLIFKASIPRAMRLMFDANLRRPGYELLGSAYDVWKAFYCLTVLLIVMFEFDNTAFAAGNFFAALLWASLGLSMWSSGMLMHRLRRPAPVPSSLRSHAAVLPAE